MSENPMGLDSLKLLGLWRNFTNKGNVKNSTENDYVCDSIPDYIPESKPAESAPQHDDQSKKINHDENTNKHSGYKSDQEFMEEEEERQETRKTKAKNGSKSKDNPSRQANYINAYNSKVQVGPTTNISMNYNYNQVVNAKKAKEGSFGSSSGEELPAQIRDIRQKRLGEDHIEYLSNHFGESYRGIGVKLGLTSGQIDIIKQNCENDFKKIAKEIMTVWMRENWTTATVGNLCQTLWNSRIRRAREAVNKLSERVEDFN